MLIGQVVRMLCAGLVHGDLSEFNILISADGPVIIDLPQAVDAAGNNHAARLLERDVENLANYLGQFAPELLGTDYGKEIWMHFESGSLTPEILLTGREISAPACTIWCLTRTQTIEFKFRYLRALQSKKAA